jgi:Protein of unknown function (DUF4031)
MGLAVTSQEAVERVLDLLRPGRDGLGCMAIADGGLPLRSQPLLHPWEPTAMAVLVDEPLWWWRGRRWCHLVSDVSLDELHAFAARAGIPARGFQGDHYDIPEEHRPDVLAAGAIPVPSRELLRRLRAAGLRLSPAQRRARAAG